MHQSTANALKFFSYTHLPSELPEVYRPFSELAAKIAAGPENEQTTRDLHKLLESKDCAVRAYLG